MCDKSINYREIWHFLHLNATIMSVPRFKVMMHKELYGRLKGTKCGEELKMYLKKHKISNRCEPFRYTWRLHNYINNKLGKKHMKYEDARRIYEDAKRLNM